MNRRGLVALLVALLAGGAVATALVVGADRAARLAHGGAPPVAVAPEDAVPAPEFAGIADWLNTTPLTMRALRGRVVLVDFWTYSCINCRRTLLFLRALHETYAPRGLTVVAVHTPEFDFEKLPANVERAVRELNVTWPVAEDPDRATWDAWRTSYWPSDFLVDRSGRIRLTHIGEGDERAVEDSVRDLLAEGGDPGPARIGSVRTDDGPHSITPEQYLGADHGRLLREGETVDQSDYAGDKVRLFGRFTGAAEYLNADRAGDRVVLGCDARDVYAVLAPPAGSAAPQRVEVLLGEKPIPPERRGKDVVADPDGRTYVVVKADDLYHLVTGPSLGYNRVDLVTSAPGLRLFTFTFGA